MCVLCLVPFHQAFSDYQLQQMTSNFIDQFGFNEDEFAEPDERVEWVLSVVEYDTIFGSFAEGL